MKGWMGVVTVLCLAAMASTAKADTMYVYAGNVMSGCNCSISGSFSTVLPLANTNFAEEAITPDAFSFTADGQTFTQDNSPVNTFDVGINVQGIVTQWDLDLGVNTNGWRMVTMNDGISSEDAVFFPATTLVASYSGMPAGWYTFTPNPVPAREPSGVVLLIVGLAGLALSKRLF